MDSKLVEELFEKSKVVIQDESLNECMVFSKQLFVANILKEVERINKAALSEPTHKFLSIMYKERFK